MSRIPTLSPNSTALFVRAASACADARATIATSAALHEQLLALLRAGRAAQAGTEMTVEPPALPPSAVLWCTACGRTAERSAEQLKNHAHENWPTCCGQAMGFLVPDRGRTPAPAPDCPFRRGDVVRAKSGGAEMTVVAVYQPIFHYRVRCGWLDASGWHTDLFRAEQLEFGTPPV
jgi:uncharacterized protein YodC (DUF2158 family)